MSIARKWVFPILRILVFAVIAAALVKLAFFADPEQPDTEVPTGEIIEPQIPVTIGTIQNDVSLTGTINADAAVPVKATFGGEVREVLVGAGAGASVAADTPIMVVRAQLVNSNGTPYTKTQTVVAGAAGILSSFTVLTGQTVAVGDTVGQIAPPSFNVTAPIEPAQLYRLSEQPTEAQVTVTGGPAPFTCTGLTITTPLAGSGGDGGSGTGGGDPGGSGSSTTVRCAVPADVRVFSGLAANLTISGGVAADVLTIPTTAVQGGADTGVVFVVGADGSQEERTVTLGLSDGVNVEVVDGLDEGEMILQFVPGAAAGGDPNAPVGPGVVEPLT